MSFIAGSFLVARSTLRDPNFSQAVVLIMAHNEEGAYGLVVNRPMPAKKLPFPVFRGGPCPSPGLILLHGHADWTETDRTRKRIVPRKWLREFSSATSTA